MSLLKLVLAKRVGPKVKESLATWQKFLRGYTTYHPGRFNDSNELQT